MYTVLIVDDEKLVLDDICTLIEWQKVGFSNIITALSVREAKRKIQIYNPHLIISDIKMGEESGLDLLSYTKKIDSQCYFIIVSAYDDFSFAQKAIRDGVFDYLLKPIDKKQLEKDLEQIYNKLKERDATDKILHKNQDFSDNNQLLEQVSSYIKQNYYKKIVISEIEGEFKVSYAVLNKLFLSNYGTTIKSYIINIKVERAMLLIKNADMPFANISLEVGYEDSFHFSKLFKKYTGFTPTEYRKYCKKQD